MVSLLVVVSWQCHRAIIVFIVWHLEHKDSQWTAEVSYSNLDTVLPHSQLSTVRIPEAHVHWSTTATKVSSILTTERHVTTLYTLKPPTENSNLIMPIKIRLVVMATVGKGKFSLALFPGPVFDCFQYAKWKPPGFLTT